VNGYMDVLYALGWCCEMERGHCAWMGYVVSGVLLSFSPRGNSRLPSPLLLNMF
jgi:hypothetical protein